MKKWKVISREIIEQNPWVKIIKDSIEGDEGKKVPDWYWFEEADFVVICGFTEQGNVLMIEQIRYPVNEPVLEFPAGLIDAGEEPNNAAFRELFEETGYTADKMIFEKQLYLDTSRSTKLGYIFFAKGLRKDSVQNLDSGEMINIKEVSFEELQKLIDDNTIKCASTISVALLALQKRKWFMEV